MLNCILIYDNYYLKILLCLQIMSSEEEKIGQLELCSQCENEMQYSNHTWRVKIDCEHTVCF